MTTLELVELIRNGGPTWQRDALCREYPNLDFVPGRQGGGTTKLLQVCGRCTVRTECLAYALADPTLVGIWGGTNTAARKADAPRRTLSR